MFSALVSSAGHFSPPSTLPPTPPPSPALTSEPCLASPPCRCVSWASVLAAEWPHDRSLPSGEWSFLQLGPSAIAVMT